jgi:hypothetical protein
MTVTLIIDGNGAVLDHVPAEALKCTDQEFAERYIFSLLAMLRVEREKKGRPVS